MKHKATLFGKVLVALALLFTTMSFAGTPANAATEGTTASCWGNGCRDRDPQAAGCSGDAYTLDSFTATWGAIVELRHSMNCGAYWTRVSPNKSDSEYTIYAQGRNGSNTHTVTYNGQCWPNGGGIYCGQVWTAMTSAAEVRSCYHARVTDCTRYHVTSMG